MVVYFPTKLGCRERRGCDEVGVQKGAESVLRASVAMCSRLRFAFMASAAMLRLIVAMCNRNARPQHRSTFHVQQASAREVRP